MLVISEVMEISQIELMLPYVDIFQVGARNMQNFNLLRELGKVRKPVLLKRGIAATIEELLCSAEYFWPAATTKSFSASAASVPSNLHAKYDGYFRHPHHYKLSHLPMTADPSHGTGRRDKVALWLWRPPQRCRCHAHRGSSPARQGALRWRTVLYPNSLPS